MISGLVALTTTMLIAAQVVPDGQREAVVTWSNVSATPGCWFFVGPEGIGRDQQLRDDACVSRRGDDVVVSISGVPFRGQTLASPIALSRRSTHEHAGKWQVEQVLALGLSATSADRLAGTYTYTECEPNERTCTGTCQIRADVVVTLTDVACGEAVAEATQ